MRSRRRGVETLPVQSRGFRTTCLKADEERRWNEELIARAQVRPWRPSWERQASDLATPCTADRCIVQPDRCENPHLAFHRSARRRRSGQGQGHTRGNGEAPDKHNRRVWVRTTPCSDASCHFEVLDDATKDVKQADDALSETNTAATASLHSEALCRESLSQEADARSERSSSEHHEDDREASARGAQPCADECIAEVLAMLQMESSKLSAAREGLFFKVREAAAEALPSFDRVSLVGSVALTIDVPSSDVDAVAFTTSCVDAVTALHDIADVLQRKDPELHVQVIDRARVPIITASTADRMVSLDMSVNRDLPDKHVSWFRNLKVFQDEHQLVVDFLRCVKYWHSQRKIPSSKEGGYPILAWMLYALQKLNLFLLEEKPGLSHHHRLLTALSCFFNLSLDRPAASPEFPKSGSLWPFPSILDPVPDKTISGNRSLVHEMPQATQLLHAGEFQRAKALVSSAVSGGSSFAALFERSEPCVLPVPPKGKAVVLKRHKLWLVEVGCVLRLRDGWTAPFLHCGDSQTELQGCLLRVGKTGALDRFPEMRQRLRFTPADVVCAGVECTLSDSVSCLLFRDLQRWQTLHRVLHPNLQEA
mmetsp:Transcript_1617/g.4086  ORF Transcript_1617/g.4086 Transcript_1617/m.4086 type:complete len:595 (+) Transcript_1617:85-1869(+)